MDELRRVIRRQLDSAEAGALHFRSMLLCRQPDAVSEADVEQKLRSWGWDGMKVRMSPCRFSRYVGASCATGVTLTPQMVEQFERDEARASGLGGECLDLTLLIEETLDGIAALGHFCELLGAGALSVPAARRAFSLWAAYEVLGFEEQLYEVPPPGLAEVRDTIPALFPTVFGSWGAWEEAVSKLVFDSPWWPEECPQPIFAALYTLETEPVIKAEFEELRFRLRPMHPPAGGKPDRPHPDRM